jgi:stress response protein YsnF
MHAVQVLPDLKAKGKGKTTSTLEINTTMSQTVIGIFDNAAEAQTAVERLTNSGFDRSMIDLSINDSTSTTSARTSVDDDRDRDNMSFGDRVSRFFKSLFDEEDERTKYAEVARRGGAIVTVHATSSDEAERISDLLDEYGAVDVDERSKSYGLTSDVSPERTSATETSYVDDTVGASTTRTLDDDDVTDRNRRIPIIEEELRVDKREVDRGTVRVRSRIVERPVEQTVRLREERVTVERNPVDRPAREGDLETFREGQIEVKQRAEVPVVSKETRVVEEINLNKDVREREETIRDTVRKTEVEVDDDTNLDIDADDISNRSRRRDDD